MTKWDARAARADSFESRKKWSTIEEDDYVRFRDRKHEELEVIGWTAKYQQTRKFMKEGIDSRGKSVEYRVHNVQFPEYSWLAMHFAKEIDNG